MAKQARSAVTFIKVSWRPLNIACFKEQAMSKLTACFSMAFLTAVMVACNPGLEGPRNDLPRADTGERAVVEANVDRTKAQLG